MPAAAFGESRRVRITAEVASREKRPETSSKLVAAAFGIVVVIVRLDAGEF
jgi:hypothetical protein